MPKKSGKPSPREDAFQTLMAGFAQDPEIGAISAVTLKGAMLSEVWRVQAKIRAMRRAAAA